MPRRTDLNHVLVIGSGPIVIGQACEFDYSGTQACRVLRADGLQVSLVNSNPATIMTDPEFADHTYVEPITPAFVERVIAQQAERGNKIDALLATLGGQTALNTAVALYENGVLEKYSVELIGADFEAIQRGEDRQRFKDIVAKVGGESARSRVCFTMEEVRETVEELGLPVVVRPSFTMGGLGSGMAHSAEDVERMAGDGLAASPSANVLVEESIFGWKEFELELMRDGHDNVVVVCSIENVDPMGVHTGDSVTVAPAMTGSLGLPNNSLTAASLKNAAPVPTASAAAINTQPADGSPYARFSITCRDETGSSSAPPGTDFGTHMPNSPSR